MLLLAVDTVRTVNPAAVSADVAATCVVPTTFGTAAGGGVGGDGGDVGGAFPTGNPGGLVSGGHVAGLQPSGFGPSATLKLTSETIDWFGAMSPPRSPRMDFVLSVSTSQSTEMRPWPLVNPAGNGA